MIKTARQADHQESGKDQWQSPPLPVQHKGKHEQGQDGMAVMQSPGRKESQKCRRQSQYNIEDPQGIIPKLGHRGTDECKDRLGFGIEKEARIYE